MRFFRIILPLLLGLIPLQAHAADLWRPKGAPAFVDANGHPRASGKLCYYSAGTTVELSVYKDEDESTEWTQPITLNSGGALTDPIFVQTGAFKEVFMDDDATTCSGGGDGTVLFTADNIPGAFDPASVGVDFALPEMTILSKSNNYTITTDDLGKIVAGDATGTAFALTLPSAVTAGNGAVIAAMKTDSGSNAITLTPVGGQTIDGASTASLSVQHQSIFIVSDGVNWHTLNSIADGQIAFAKMATSAYSTDTTFVGASNSKFATQLAIKTYVDTAVTASIKWKDPVRVATTANGTLASAYENGDTVDGVVLATNDRILLKNQTTQTENGIYTVNASGAPTRATDADADAEIPGATVFVTSGSTNAGAQYTCPQTAVTIGATDITFSLISQGSAIPTAAVMCGARSTVPNGWLWASGKTIGNASSSATERANSDTQTLYSELWGAFSNTELPIQDSAGSATVRGASASADFSANKRLPLPDLRGRVIAGNDTMDSTSANRLTTTLNGDTLGATGGEELHTMTTGELATHAHGEAGTFQTGTETAAHTHTASLTVTASGSCSSCNTSATDNILDSGSGTTVVTSVASSGSVSVSGSADGTTGVENQTHTHFVVLDGGSTDNAGSSTPFNVLQPTYILNCFIKY